MTSSTPRSTDTATAAREHAVLERFSPAVSAWFSTTFVAPTAAQAQGWPAIADGEHTLILAPTGSGKTLTAFLWAIDRLVTAPEPEKKRRLKVLYISPLRALAVDVERNLRAPLRGIQLAAERLDEPFRPLDVGIRTGDTEQRDRQRMARTPPDVLITTPESLYLLLTSRARETLRDVDTVIIDEIHAMVTTKRGSHLALSLERLEEEVARGARERDQEFRPPQRIALSATQRPLDEVARFLGGHRDADGTVGGGEGPDGDGPRREARDVTIVDAGVSKELDLEVIGPLEDMSDLGQVIAEPDLLAGPAAAAPVRKSIWPAIHPRLLDLVLEHRSTIVFVNSRRLAERLASRLNDLWTARVRGDHLRELGVDPDALDPQDPDLPDEVVAALDMRVDDLVLAHHGSLSKDRRGLVEDQLKSGTLRGLVATSSLELGIDMGAVDLVVQVGSPGAVARGLQRVGRAGHQVGEPSRGRLFPRYRGDLLELAVVTERMHDGGIESSQYPRVPLDVLAQHVVAMVAMDDWTVDDLAAVVRRAAPFVDLTDDVLAATLDLLAGRYPSDEFSELRPRITWDRINDVLTARPGAQRLAVTNPGTIPDRGLYGVFLPDGGRVGELDEEMVHESRAGETFLLGASTWRIEDITHDRVVVTPAPGRPGKMPFWHGEGPGRPHELGVAMGTFVREVAGLDADAARQRLRDDHDLDDWAADNLLGYLAEQLEVTGTLPDDRTIVVERFRDELGDWRVCLLSHFGARVHAPWAMALERQLSDAGLDPEVMWTDDGIVVRLQAAADDLDLDMFLVDPDEVESLVTAQLAGTAMFTTTFREASGRALLLPKRRPGQRTALWQQRQRAANLLQVASGHPSFPMLLESTREILRDRFEIGALRQLLRDLQSRTVRLVAVDTDQASPFAASLLFSWVGQWMYDYDAPLAERRAAALSLDPDLLRELLGGDELRDLVDPDVLVALEVELQRLEPLDPDVGTDRRARNLDALHDLLVDLGDLTRTEIAARCRPPAGEDPMAWIDELLAARRAIEVGVADEVRIAAAEDAARLRDAIGVALPPGLPAAFTDPVDDPLADLVSRYARTHGPFLASDVTQRLGIPRPRVEAALQWLAARDRVLHGAFRPAGTQSEWCDAGVVRRLRQRSLAALRREVEPVEPDAYARFLLSWHHVGSPRRGGDALLDAIAQLEGVPIPASILEADVLPARVADYHPADLDAVMATGEVVWLGVDSIGANDGRVVLCFRDSVAAVVPALGGAGDDSVLGASASAESAAVGDGASAEASGEETADPAGSIHDALRAHLRRAGASFWPDLFAASGVADQDQVVAALWDLVWAGEVTNDGFAPVRGLASSSPTGRRSRRGRPRPGRLRRLGPPSVGGRWWLTTQVRTPVPDETRVATTIAERLLERHGVVTGEGTRAEKVRGGYASVYPVLKVMEGNGAVRRGWFVAGLGAAQFAVPGVVDRLRDHRESGDGDVVVLAAADPAQPYGAALPWPPTQGRPSRSAGARVVLVDGVPAVLLERGGKSLVTFPAAAEGSGWVGALVGIVSGGQLAKLEIRRV
ncbi:MAG TPA: DEAD/DEAH box helicase, partial [Nitriliruptoraceae bacterium]|nr:DEAD/DEAH box helicase [Nitriliruptoraceae bacterium]